MNEDKGYSIVGQVTIGTDEYRDLIESSMRAVADMENYRGKYWAEESKIKKLEEEIKSLKDKLGTFALFLAENSTIKADYDNFKIRKRLEQEDE